MCLEPDLSPALFNHSEEECAEPAFSIEKYGLITIQIPKSNIADARGNIKTILGL